MASTFDPSHPVPIVGTQEGIVQQAYAHTYDADPKLPEKTSIDEKNRSSSEAEAVVIDGDIIRESGMFSMLIRLPQSLPSFYFWNELLQLQF